MPQSAEAEIGAAFKATELVCGNEMVKKIGEDVSVGSDELIGDSNQDGLTSLGLFLFRCVRSPIQSHTAGLSRTYVLLSINIKVGTLT